MPVMANSSTSRHSGGTATSSVHPTIIASPPPSVISISIAASTNVWSVPSCCFATV
jgi:hypothetical protein